MERAIRALQIVLFINIFFFFSLVSVTLGHSVHNDTEQDKAKIQELMKEHKDRVFKVYIIDKAGMVVGLGSGFVLKYKNKLWLITNSHVCLPYPVVNGIKIGVDNVLVVTRIRSKTGDLCAAPIKNYDLPYFEMRDEDLKEYQDIYTIGYPKGVYNGSVGNILGPEFLQWINGWKSDYENPEKECLPDDGSISNIDPGMCLKDEELIVSTLRSTGGASGSPVFDKDNKVFAVIAAGTNGFSLAVTWKDLKSFMDEISK